jgi:hypothetical protein
MIPVPGISHVAHIRPWSQLQAAIVKARAARTDDALESRRLQDEIVKR